MTSPAVSVRSLGRFKPSEAIFFLCDVQTRFKDLIHNMPSVLWTTSALARASHALGIPTIVTEQYPKALGHTCEEVGLSALDPAPRVFEKKLFSMVTPEVDARLAEEDLAGRRNVILAGIEAHVCVLQTALDLLERDYTVHLVVDGVSSQREIDRSAAIERLKRLDGVFLTTSESVLFLLLQTAENPNLKAISAIMKEKRPAGFFSSL